MTAKRDTIGQAMKQIAWGFETLVRKRNDAPRETRDRIREVSKALSPEALDLMFEIMKANADRIFIRPPQGYSVMGHNGKERPGLRAKAEEAGEL